MKYNEDQLVQEFKRISLTSAEKLLVRNQLLTYMQKHPLSSVRSNVGTRLISDGKEWRALPFLAPFFVPSLPIAVGILGVSVLWASADAAPGDFFYSFRVNVLEELYERLALRREQRFSRAKKRLALRLREAQNLVAMHMLDPELSKLMEAYVERQLERTLKMIAHSELKGQFEWSASWTKELDTLLSHYQPLFREMHKQLKAPSAVFALMARLQAHKEITPAFSGQEKREPRLSYEDVARIVQERIGLVKKHLNDVAHTLEPQFITTTKNEIKEIETLFKKGKECLQKGMRNEAFAVLQEAHRGIHLIQITLEEAYKDKEYILEEKRSSVRID